VCAKPLSHVGDGAIEPCLRWCCQGDIGRGAMSLLSHACDGAAEETWPWRDVAVESCWRWHCRGSASHGVMSRPSYADNGATMWPWCDVVADDHAYMYGHINIK
jgi:hypothetical protein